MVCAFACSSYLSVRTWASRSACVAVCRLSSVLHLAICCPCRRLIACAVRFSCSSARRSLRSWRAVRCLFIWWFGQAFGYQVVRFAASSGGARQNWPTCERYTQWAALSRGKNGRKTKVFVWCWPRLSVCRLFWERGGCRKKSVAVVLHVDLKTCNSFRVSPVRSISASANGTTLVVAIAV